MEVKVVQVGKFYPPRWGGMETALKDICEVLRRQVELEVLVANDRARTIEEDCGGVRVTRLACLGTLFSQPITPGVAGRLRRSSAEIVHLHEPNPLAMMSYLAVRRNAGSAPGRLVIHYHSDIVRQRKLLPLYRPWLEKGLGEAAAVIAGSRELVDSSPVLGRWRSKCEVIPFGIDLDPFVSLPLPRRPASPPEVLAVGRLSYYKGFQYLIEAMRDVPARLVIVGEGEMRAGLEEQIRRLGLEGRVTLAGRATSGQLLARYSEASVFCLSSCERSEAFGLVQVEAMGSGLPVVSTRLDTGVRAVNAHGETGLVVSPHDSQELARALQRILADGPMRRRMGEAARKRAVTLFSRERMGRSILNLYEAVRREAPRGGTRIER